MPSDTISDTPRNVTLARLKHLKLRGRAQFQRWLNRPLLNPLSVLTLPALQRLHIEEDSLLDPIAALQSLLFHWGSSPQEIYIGFPALPLHQYCPPSFPVLLGANPSRFAFWILCQQTSA
ncbi:hypothetical protein B0H16DRAFT_1905506 [Mycena metata]|uniref:Uncharacterized protein n=1 Tax=Mycena metata TaxID=1033252 RepID=A0AAD7DD57_9AGAR|nr:hypothetical protein B0H16DRAFT_1905506 [Mycena metata]